MSVEKYKQHRQDVAELLLKAERVLYQNIIADIETTDVRYTGNLPKDDPVEKIIDHFYASLFQIDFFYKTCVERLTREKFADAAGEVKAQSMVVTRHVNKHRMEDLKCEWHTFLAQEEEDGLPQAEPEESIYNKFNMLKNKELYA